MSLVDDQRRFFKSQIGLLSPVSEQRQTPLSHSFCQWVVSGQEELVVQDARTHPILSANGAVADLGVIAYAGVPLSAVMDKPIGSFCAIDGQPRQWTDDELATLRDFAQLVDGHEVLNLPEAVGSQSGARERYFQAATRATARSFLGAVRLLRRDRPPLGDEGREALLGIIERRSHQLIDSAAHTAQP